MSFWISLDATRQAAWRLLCAAATLGQAIQRAGERLPGRSGLDAAVESYVEHGAVVDRAHRHLEQQRAATLHPMLPAFDLLRARLDAMRDAWRMWADNWACDFNGVCRAHGFLPSASQQQRTIFDEVVRPLAQDSGVTAYTRR